MKQKSLSIKRLWDFYIKFTDKMPDKEANTIEKFIRYVDNHKNRNETVCSSTRSRRSK